MPNPSRRVFYAVLDMGLGHASRSLPLLREFRARGWDLHVGSSGRALALLRAELPGAAFLEIPGYGIRYTRRGADLPHLMLQGPRLLAGVRAENRMLRAYGIEHPPDLVVSDNCFGCWLEGIPSWLIHHQLRFIAPPPFGPLEELGVYFNRALSRHYRGVLVPDSEDPERPGEGLLSGRLSRAAGMRVPVRYVGTLADLGTLPTGAHREGPSLDVLVIVSGPEPQRTVLEEKVRAQIGGVAGRCVMVLGRPESDRVERPTHDLEIHHHADRRTLASLLARARMVVGRPGYSTVMELAERGGRALFIPTPGQTEQEYLARRLADRGWIKAVPQRELDLPAQVAQASRLPGIPSLGKTADTVARLFEEVFAPAVGAAE